MAARAKRILFVSGSVGLGHATRDLAIAVALRRERPDVTVGWLAGNPAREWLREAGEWVLPEADACGDLSQVAERAAGSGQIQLAGDEARSAGHLSPRMRPPMSTCGGDCLRLP